MNMKKLLPVFLFCFLLFPAPSFAQRRDPLYKNLQSILDDAVTDFRGYREKLVASPDVSIVGARIPCQLTEWANNVSLYICSAQVPASSAESWYINVLASLRALQPSWEFRINSPISDHFVEAGPPNCQVSDTQGPYIGLCPVHLQVNVQNNGMAKVYFWMSSLSSPYLGNRPPDAPSTAVPPDIPASCDELCQGLKKAFDARLSDFADITAAKTNGGGMSGVTLKLSGARECDVHTAAKPHSTETGLQYACYWPETSASSAEARFHDLVSRFQVLAPSAWASHKEDQIDQLTGAKVAEWCATAPGGKQQACVDILGESVGLHITSWN